MDKRISVIFLFFCCSALSPCFAQEEVDPPRTDPQEQTDAKAGEEKKDAPPAEETGPISGGIVYNPERNEDDKLRDPFTSPFELESKKRDAAKISEKIPFKDQRLPIPISDLDLTGIYLQAKTGYLAIFRVGDDYKWFRAGTKFLDADLVNITDRSVVFKHYVSGEDLQVREVVKVLRRGEE